MANNRITSIIVDADDTLWHNEKHFHIAERRFLEVMSPYADEQSIRAQLSDRGIANLNVYGYGARSFTLSMVESALQIGGDALSCSVIREILSAGRELLSHPIELFDGVTDALADLGRRAGLVLLTKGDLLHQETKIAASGVAARFEAVEIVSDKNKAVLERIVAKYASRPDAVVVAGDSLRSDVVPAIQIGAWAAHIPHPLAWSHESADLPDAGNRFRELSNLGELAPWIDEINEAGSSPPDEQPIHQKG